MGGLNPHSDWERSGWIFAAYNLKAELVGFTGRFYVNITKRSPTGQTR